VAQVTSRYGALFLVLLGILIIFVGRTVLASAYAVPHLSDTLVTIAVIGSITVCVSGHGILHRRDWGISMALGVLVAVGMYHATLFTPYPIFGIGQSQPGHALLRGVFTMLATLGGLTIMRQGGPVRVTIADKAWRTTVGNVL
jgi:hypothetical protein